MSASLDGVGSQTDISSLLILPRLSFLYLKFEYFMTHFCMCVLNLRRSIPTFGILSYSCQWSLKREKLVIQKRRGKNQENFATASRDGETGKQCFCLWLCFSRGERDWYAFGLKWSWAQLWLNYFGIERNLSMTSLASLQSFLLKPQGITKLQVGHAVGISRWGQWFWDRRSEDC